jgi:hypothetical protein
MNSLMSIQLDWRGPIGVGTLPDRKGQESLRASHVYLTIQRYAGHRVIYVGQSTNLLKRVCEHYDSFLGLYYCLRRRNGKKFYDPSTDDMFEFMNHLDEQKYKLVLEDVKRLQICHAECDPDKLNPVESTLINRVMDAHNEEGSRYKCDNARRQNFGYDQPISIQMNTKNLASEAKTVLADLFGDGPVIGSPT